MKKTINLNVDADKISALEMYLEQKNSSLSEELDKYAEQLYQKNVPQNVRDYIERTAEKNSGKQRRNPQ